MFLRMNYKEMMTLYWIENDYQFSLVNFISVKIHFSITQDGIN